MLGVTLWASLDKNVLVGFSEVWSTRWGIATLADAGCGFLTFFAWVFYREGNWAGRVGWFLAIMLLGNIAMSVYVLRLLFKLGPNAGAKELLLRPSA